eukprot:Skav218036  [mRNA]  locus=scaffold214:567369:568229:+ [translate_table: standard]
MSVARDIPILGRLIKWAGITEDTCLDGNDAAAASDADWNGFSAVNSAMQIAGAITLWNRRVSTQSSPQGLAEVDVASVLTNTINDVVGIANQAHVAKGAAPVVEVEAPPGPKVKGAESSLIADALKKLAIDSCFRSQSLEAWKKPFV